MRRILFPVVLAITALAAACPATTSVAAGQALTSTSPQPTTTTTATTTTSNPPPPPANPPSLLADFESGTFGEWNDGASTSNGSITVGTDRAYTGSHSAHAHINGAGVNGYARTIEDVSWGQGTDEWYGGAFYLPIGFKAAMQGQVALVRWDDYPSVASGADKCGTNGGLVINNSDKQARLISGTYSYSGCPGQNVLVGPFNLAEGSWQFVDIHQRILQTSGQALTEVYLNGNLVGSSTAANDQGNFLIQRVRYGIVADGAGSQQNPLDVWTDRDYIGSSQLGP